MVHSAHFTEATCAISRAVTAQRGRRLTQRERRHHLGAGLGEPRPHVALTRFQSRVVLLLWFWEGAGSASSGAAVAEQLTCWVSLGSGSGVPRGVDRVHLT